MNKTYASLFLSCLSVFFAVMGGTSAAQECVLAGTAAWSQQLRTVLANCDYRYKSPNGKLTLQFNLDGQIFLSGIAALTALRPVSPPAMLSWAPNSNAFFVNDGEGSGMSSTFRLFRIEGGKVLEDDTSETKAVAIFRNLKRCDSKLADPSVWGLGWSRDGNHLYLLVQATVNDSCGAQGEFIGLTINLRDGTVEKQLSEKSTKQAFHALLPREVYSR